MAQGHPDAAAGRLELPGSRRGFILYSRSWCHLCEDMLHALQAMAPPSAPFDVAVIDVDADPALVARFDELVPVLFSADGAGAEGEQLCHYFLDRAAVERYLAGPGPGDRGVPTIPAA